MAQFHDCLASAAAQGAISREEADMLRSMYDAQVKALGDDLSAKAKLAETLTAEAERKARLARLSAERADALAEIVETYRGPDGKADVVGAAIGILDNRNNRLLGAPSVTGRRDALQGYARGALEEFLYETRRKLGSGFRRGAMIMDNMIDEAFGKATGDAKAAAFLRDWQRVADALVDRFNAAGGSIAKLPNYIPQYHDAGKMLAGGKAAWMDYIAPRLDISAMTDPLSGGPLTPARLTESLGVIYDRIVTDGAIDVSPSMATHGRGALANQRQEHRFLQFKSADAWRDYAAAYGRNDIHAALMAHIDGLAKDTAALEVLGPNPNATVSWLKQIVESEVAKAQLGQPSLYKGTAAARMGDPAGPIDRLWTVVNGSAGTGNVAMADALTGARNWLTSAQLGATALTAFLGDPFQQRNARVFAGVPTLQWFADLPRQLFSGASKREIARAGVVLGDAMEHLTMDLRGRSWTNSSAELTKWLPDRVFQWTGLQPWTQVNRRAQAQSFMFEAGDRTTQSLADIAADGTQGRRFARWLQGFGIGDATWDLIRAVKPADHGEAGGMITMMDIVRSAPGDRAAFEAALRYGDAVNAFVEEAVPQGTASVRAALGRSTAAGTVAGEITRSSTMYLSYPVTVMMSLIRAAQWEMAEAGAARGGLSAAASFISLAIGGALVLQLAELRNGRDPKPVNNLEFWALAAAKGGGWGFFGDYVFADYTRGATQTVSKLAGPVVNTLGDAIAVVSPRDAANIFSGEDETNRAKRLVDFGRRNTPFTSMWMIRPAMERLVWDRLSLLADPNAHRQWRQAERRLMRDEGQGMWWGRGEAEPRRGPDFTTIWGN